jgi:small GTP-binding protein
MTHEYIFEGHKCEILPEDYLNTDYSFKIILIGNSGVGKTSLTLKATKNIFNLNYNATVGFEFSTFIVKVDNYIIKLQIWDTCGQEIYRGLITNFYKNCSLAIIVYSIDNRDSFNDIDDWIKELKINSKPDAKIFLIGNKTDLEENRKVEFNEGEEIKKNYNFDYFNEASAKSGINTKELFIKAALLLCEDYKKFNKKEKSSSLISLTISNHNEKKKLKKKKCC